MTDGGTAIPQFYLPLLTMEARLVLNISAVGVLEACGYVTLFKLACNMVVHNELLLNYSKVCRYSVSCNLLDGYMKT
jgi:hypothetical protein